jgi:hypothetical protein
MRSTGKSKTQNKLQWVLPHTVSNDEWTFLPSQLSHQTLLLARLNEFAAGFSASATTGLDPRSLRQCYLRGAKTAGWLTRAGHVRLRCARQEFLRQAAALADIPEFSFIKSVNGNSGGFLATLFRSSRAHLHPTKHLLVTALLFGDWADFWDCYTQMADVSCNSSEASFSDQCAGLQVDALLKLISAGKKTLAQAARDLDIPYDVARYRLKRAGVVYTSPRPPSNV